MRKDHPPNMAKPWSLWAAVVITALWSLWLFKLELFVDYRMNPLGFILLAIPFVFTRSQLLWTFSAIGIVGALFLIVLTQFSSYEPFNLRIAALILLLTVSLVLFLLHFRYPFVNSRGSFVGGQTRLSMRMPAYLYVGQKTYSVFVVDASETGVGLDISETPEAKMGDLVSLKIPDASGFSTKAIVVRADKTFFALRFHGWTLNSLREHLKYVLWLRKEKNRARSGTIPSMQNSRGFTLMEVLIVAPITVLVLFGTLEIMAKLDRTSRQNMTQYQIEMLKNEISTTIHDTTAWKNTVEDTGNPALSCLRNRSSCLDASSRGNLRLRNSQNQIVIDSVNPTSGFDISGQVCNQFDAANGNDTCPFRFVLASEPICEGTCMNPAVHLTVTLEYRPQNNPLPLNTARHGFSLFRDPMIDSLQENCESLNGTFNAVSGTCDWTRLASSCRAFGQFLVGYDDSGKAICTSVTAQSCAAGLWMVGFNPDGTIVCEIN